jgi:uncharacterized protein (TIGR03000 family)
MGGCGAGGCGAGGYAMGGGYGGGGYALAGTIDMSTAVVATTPVAQEAVLVVTLPENAILTIDEAATTSTTGQRIFRTPDLEQGKDFHYTLKARYNQNGKEETITQKVTVRAGQVTNVSLTAPAADSTATAMAR